MMKLVAAVLLLAAVVNAQMTCKYILKDLAKVLKDFVWNWDVFSFVEYLCEKSKQSVGVAAHFRNAAAPRAKREFSLCENSERTETSTSTSVNLLFGFIEGTRFALFLKYYVRGSEFRHSVWRLKTDFVYKQWQCKWGWCALWAQCQIIEKKGFAGWGFGSVHFRKLW